MPVLASAEGLRRAWKSVDNVIQEMELVASDGKTATFQMKGKRPIVLPLTKLALDDRKIIRGWLVKQAAAPQKRPWPKSVEVTLREVEIEDLGKKKGWHRYQTQHFLFRSEEALSVSLMREVARTFEATHRMVAQMPWALPPRAPGAESGGRFVAELYRNRSTYQKAGGPSQSGGVYLFGYRDTAHYGRFLVPFESLGVRKVGGSYRKHENFSSDTLVHELSHQLMHFTLFLIPHWVAEGSAEYFETMPFHAGRFRPDALGRAIKERFSHRPPPHLSKDLVGFIRLNDAGWKKATSNLQAMGRAYDESLLLFYFFSHLDGKKNGARLLSYFGKVSIAQQQWVNHLDAWGEYMDEWDVFLGNPEVKRLPDGRYQFPENLRPPVAPENPFPQGVDSLASTLVDELLAGRSSEQLRAEIRKAYQEVGIKIP